MSTSIRKLIYPSWTGQISEAATLNSTAETLQSELDSLLSSIKPSAQEETIMRQEKRLNVCEICGSFLVVGDTSQRLELHMVPVFSNHINCDYCSSY
ncbi:hypothetical protein BKA69DRAFT_490176 [Paraphysoderma sedebokerense]|nr:hypothetical protein BKA69DRAFT_490176 [Paraphysoderma sedebokerense]